MSDISDIIARLEASGPDRELDAEIAVALRLGEYTSLDGEEHGYPAMIPPDDHWAKWRKTGHYNFHHRSGTSLHIAPQFTADEETKQAALFELRTKAVSA